MIYVSEPSLNGNEEKYLVECIRTNFVSSEGPFVKRFEEACAKYFESEYAITVNNGTAALETAFYAIGLEEGDEIIMPSLTIISCAIAAIRLGAKPVLVDIDPLDWNMNVDQIEAKITDKTKAILAVDIYGSPVNYDRLFELKEKYNLIIVEDYAEAQGAGYFSKKLNKFLKCGGIGDIGATSFYANKTITTGEGGLVTTNDPKYAERAQSYRNLCFIPEDRFRHEELGYNFRMSNIQAAVGLAQLERIDEFIQIKIKNGEYYKQKFKGVEGLKFHPVKEHSKTIYWMYCIELDPELGITAKEMMHALNEHEIGVRPFFRGLHDQPVLNRLGYFIGEAYPVTDHAYKYAFYIPSGVTLTTGQMDQVTDTIKKTLSKKTVNHST